MMTLTTKNMTEIARKLEMDIRDGKHVNARLVVGGILAVSTSWPHGRKEIPKGTANKILKSQLFLDTQAQGYALRDCDMKLPDYIDHLVHKGVIKNGQK